MAGEFISWAALYAKAKDALASGQITRFMMQTIENRREMRSTMGSSRDTAFFLEWLSQRATEELLGGQDGDTYFEPMGGEG